MILAVIGSLLLIASIVDGLVDLFRALTLSGAWQVGPLAVHPACLPSIAAMMRVVLTALHR
jgi:hypothetical protein